MTAQPSRWWDPTYHSDRRPFLIARNRMRDALRTWFGGEDFIEVETACLQVSPGNELHLRAFRTRITEPDGRAATAFLHTSPEFACKKLLAAGEPRLFTFARCFRDGERSRLHEPEFTMLEWYRADAPFERLLADCDDILAVAAEATGASEFRHGDRVCKTGTAAEHLTVGEAFERFVQFDLARHLADSGGDRDAFARVAAERDQRVAHDDTWSDIFARLMTALIEPNLGHPNPTLLTHYPIREAALARSAPKDPTVAERVELYVCGVEVANGFGELTDPAEQRRRFAADMAEKQVRYGDCYPIDEDFLDAVGCMPDAIGAALGFDRLVMLATGAPRLTHVVWTPVADFTDRGDEP